MPTYNRRAFVPHAIHYFLRQDYAPRELIVLDDGSDPVVDLMPADPRIRYIRLETRQILGVKRNLGCTAANGDIIVHWDDDDWQASWRLSYQVHCLLKNAGDLCGLKKLFFYDPASARGWRYVYPETRRPWVHVGTLCYTKSFWARNPFPATHLAAGGPFLGSSHPKKVVTLHDERFYVGLVHAQNANPKRPQPATWHACSIETIQRVLGEDWSLYQR